MATNEELEQRLAEIEPYFQGVYDPPSGPEYSFPVPGQPIDQDQFQLLSLTDGNGIIDRGDYPYWLEGWGSTAETNQKNSMILKVGGQGKAEAVVGGYYHVLTEDKTIPLDPVTSETTYYICLTFDPRYITEVGDLANQSISVQVYDSAPPTTFGRIHLVLYTVTRKPNQLLTDATIERFRPRGAPSISVLKREHLPDAQGVLFGSMGIVYGENDIVVARGASTDEGGPNRWDSMLDPDWTDLGDNNYYGWAGHGYKRGYRMVGGMVELRGHIKRINTSDPFLKDGGANTAGYAILSLPGDLAPEEEQRFISATNNYSGNRLAVITVSKDGTVYAATILGDATWISLDGIRFPVNH